jgi:hypothetical protein
MFNLTVNHRRDPDAKTLKRRQQSYLTAQICRCAYVNAYTVPAAVMTLRLRRSPQKFSTFNVIFYCDLSFIDNPLYSDHLNLGDSVNISTPVPWDIIIRSAPTVCVHNGVNHICQRIYAVTAGLARPLSGCLAVMLDSHTDLTPYCHLRLGRPQ